MTTPNTSPKAGQILTEYQIGCLWTTVNNGWGLMSREVILKYGRAVEADVLVALTDPDGTSSVEDVRVAMRKAFQIGQTYFQQADSESVSQNSKSDETSKKFSKLVADTCDALAAGIAQPAVPGASLAAVQAIDGEHARNCSGYDAMQDCTCGLRFKQQIATLQSHLGTEQSLHAAWRKRAEEAEQAAAAAPAPVSGRWKLEKLAVGEYGFTALTPTEPAGELPPLPEWSKMDDLGGLVPSEIRTALKEYARTVVAAVLGKGEPEMWRVRYLCTAILNNCVVEETKRDARMVYDAIEGKSAAPAGIPVPDRTLWTDEQRENHRKNRALVYSCTICCARKGEPHLPSCSEGQVPVVTYLVTITFEDGVFSGRATATSEALAYGLILQDARMGSARGPQYHGKVLNWKAESV